MVYSSARLPARAPRAPRGLFRCPGEPSVFRSPRPYRRPAPVAATITTTASASANLPIVGLKPLAEHHDAEHRADGRLGHRGEGWRQPLRLGAPRHRVMASGHHRVPQEMPAGHETAASLPLPRSSAPRFGHDNNVTGSERI